MRQKACKLLHHILCSSLVFASLLAATPMLATPVLMNQSVPPPQPVAQVEASTNNDMAVFISAADNRDTSQQQPFKVGPVVFRPHISYQYAYARGLLFAQSNAANSSINTIAPGIAVDLGRHWTFDYTPTIQIYSDKALHNNVGHAVSLVGNMNYEDWAFGFSQTYARSDTVLVETASQTVQDSYGTSISASHQLNEKFSTDLSLSQQIVDVSNAQSTRFWSLQDWVNYQVANRIFLGVGGTLGYVNVDVGPDQLSEDLQARIHWRVTDKIGFSLRGGLEYRQILDDAYSDPLNPIFGLDVQYAPFKQTQITLTADRLVGSSQYYIIGQTTESTSVRLMLNQRLLEKYNFSAGTSYTHTDYTTTLGSISAVRSDDGYGFSVGINRNIFKRGNIGLSYQYSKNTSSQSGFSYLSNQIMFQASYAY